MTIHDNTRLDDAGNYSTSRFPLLRRLSLVSLLTALVAGTLLVLLYRQDQLAEHAEIAAEINERTLFQLTSALGNQISAYVSNAERTGGKPMLASPDLDALFSDELREIKGSDVLKLKIYNLAGTAIYSSAKSEIGGGSKHSDFLVRALSGETVHGMEHRDKFLTKNGEMRGVEVALTYKPLEHAGKRIGVLEIYDDATPLFNRLKRNTISIVLIVMGVFFVMYATLFFAIYRADLAIRKWQNAVVESRNLLKIIIDTVPASVFWKDLESRFMGCNLAFARDSGSSSPQDIIGKTDEQMGWKEQAERYRADDRQVMESGIPKLSYDEQQTTPDGKSIWLRVSKVPLRNAANETIGVLGIYRDVTERKQVEEVLMRYKRVIKTAMDGFWSADEKGYLLDANEAYAQMSGYTVDELIGMHISQLNAIDQPETVMARISKIIKQGHARFETTHRRKDGHLVDIEAAVTFMPETRQFFVFCHDITRRKHNERELRVAAATFETHEAIVITDVNANIIRVNRAFSEITGYSAGEVLGKNPRVMSSGRHDRSFYIEMWQQLLHTGHWAGEIWDRRKSGEVYPKWMTITAVKNEHQEPTHYVAIFSDITARKRIEEEIHNLAFYDVLTKLPNRRLFLDRFRTALLASARRDDYGAVLFIDLDRFKVLNDTLGHECGDLLLQEVGARIKSCVREMDTVARFGGDEFVVLIEGFGKERDDVTHRVALVAEKIRDALARPYYLRGHEHCSSPSIGISLYHGNEDTLDSLIERADMAMYQAKNSGRNTVRFFDPVMQQKAATHDALENDLHHAIESQQLHLHYQIQVDRNNRPLGAEAFLRWMHPAQGLILPGQFLPIAEESGLIVDISRWVLQMACQQICKWDKDGKTRGLTLTVNISARHFALPGFVAEVADVLKAHKTDPSRLKMELSEQLVLTEANSTMEKIHALRDMGIKLTMDNFNMVYSSLSFIRELSSDQLKIHQAFVQGITEEGNDAQLVQAIIDLAKSMDMDVFAEGVETEEQRTFLKRHDCTTYQGYLFGKPVSIEKFEEELKKM